MSLARSLNEAPVLLTKGGHNLPGVKFGVLDLCLYMEALTVAPLDSLAGRKCFSYFKTPFLLPFVYY